MSDIESLPADASDQPSDLVTSEPNAYQTALFMVQRVDAEALLAKAIEQNVSMETMERLIALRERLKAEQARELFFSALSSFQAECPIIPKTKTASIQSARGSYKYAYAPLEVIVERCTPLLAKYGLSVTFDTRLELEPLSQVAICTVHHVAGHAVSSEFRAPIDADARMNDMQKSASAVTYAKRYAYCNSLGILTGDEDDDAHATSAKDAFPPPRRTTTPPEVKGSGEGSDRTPGPGLVTPPPRVALITREQQNNLEGELRKYAEAFGVTFESIRAEAHERMVKKWKKHSFKELTADELTVVMQWLNGKWNEKA